MFGALALYGSTTRRSLAGVGQFVFMGLIGVILASIVGMFWHSDALQFVISVVGVIVFTGLTAWDAQRLKQMARGDAGRARSAPTPSSARCRSTSTSSTSSCSCCASSAAGGTSGARRRYSVGPVPTSGRLPIGVVGGRRCRRGLFAASPDSPGLRKRFASTPYWRL